MCLHIHFADQGHEGITIERLEMATDPAELTLQLYQLTANLSSSMVSSIHKVTGVRINQKRLFLSFARTLVRDFVLAFGVRAGIKLIPKLLKGAALKDLYEVRVRACLLILV